MSEGICETLSKSSSLRIRMDLTKRKRGKCTMREVLMSRSIAADLKLSLPVTCIVYGFNYIGRGTGFSGTHVMQSIEVVCK